MIFTLTFHAGRRSGMSRSLKPLMCGRPGRPAFKMYATVSTSGLQEAGLRVRDGNTYDLTIRPRVNGAWAIYDTHVGVLEVRRVRVRSSLDHYFPACFLRMGDWRHGQRVSVSLREVR